MTNNSNPTTKADVLLRLRDLHKQATVERSHYYVGSVVHDAIDEIERLRTEIASHRSQNMRDFLTGRKRI